MDGKDAYARSRKVLILKFILCLLKVIDADFMFCDCEFVLV